MSGLIAFPPSDVYIIREISLYRLAAVENICRECPSVIYNRYRCSINGYKADWKLLSKRMNDD